MNFLLRSPILIALPLLAYLSSWYYNGQVIPLLVLSSAFLLLWVGAALWPRLGAGLPWPKGFVPLFMLVWFVWFWLTLFWSTEPYSSWFYFWTLGSLPLAFLGYACMLPTERERIMPWLWHGVLLLAWVLSFLALSQYFSAMDRGEAEFVLRVKGPLMDTNSFAAWMNLLYFPVLFRYFHRDGQRQGKGVDAYALFLLLTLLFLTFAFWATYSRGGALAWVFTMAIAMVALRKTPKYWPRMALVWGMVLASYALFGYLHHYDMIGHLAPGFIASQASTVSRGLMWIATWHIFLAHPYLGTGLGSYFLYYPAYRLPGELASAGTYAHNDYIEYLAEGGVINLGFLLAFAGALMYALYKLIFRAGRSLVITEARRYWAIGLVLGVFAITGHALGNFIFYNLPLSILGGLFLAMAWHLYGSGEETAPLLPRMGIIHASIPRLALVLVIAAVIWFLALDAAVYGLFSANGWLNTFLPNANTRAVFLMRAARFLEVARPLATQPWVYMGNAYQNLAVTDRAMPEAQKRVLLEAALQQYRQSLVGITRQAGVYNAIGNVYSQNAAILGLSPTQARDKALLAWRKGLAIEPESINLRSEIASNAFFARGDVQGGIAFLEAGLARPLFPEPRAVLEWVIARDQWQLAHDAPAAIHSLQASLKDQPDFAPALDLLRQIGHKARSTSDG
ncbi:O-antigen ligase family protein [Acidithiobacillus acidisediminis]|uniref:O-antigen ligase family protein n=1 Tax=Acidithiobacillus acidisediminis TaxID=2937799 RepID=UPI002010AE5C|nr:O-antigen ligase family protein [Acidithiobacillus sp. S30A2]